MRNFLTLLLAFFVSLIFAGALQTQIAVKFGAQEEHILSMMVFMVMTIVTTVALGVALLFSVGISGVDRTAIGLLVLTLLGLAALVAVALVADRKLAVGRADLGILVAIGLPTVLMILIQWWFVRRRWFKANQPV